MRNSWWIVILVTLAACQPLAGRHAASPVPPCPARMDDETYWLEEWHWVIELSEAQLQEMLKLREHEFEQSANPTTRMRLALLLAEGPQPVRDQTRALELLKGLDTAQASNHVRALAAMLIQVIEEQRWSLNKISDLNRELKASQTRIEELELQLQELTTIEKKIQQREIPNNK